MCVKINREYQYSRYKHTSLETFFQNCRINWNLIFNKCVLSYTPTSIIYPKRVTIISLESQMLQYLCKRNLIFLNTKFSLPQNIRKSDSRKPQVIVKKRPFHWTKNWPGICITYRRTLIMSESRIRKEKESVLNYCEIHTHTYLTQNTFLHKTTTHAHSHPTLNVRWKFCNRRCF